MTKYCVLVRYKNRDEQYVSKEFDSMMLRAIYIISLPLEAEMIREWEE